MRKKQKNAFTLIELLMVMSLMVLITTIAVTGAFGMTRAASYTAAQDVVFNTLQAAKQRACITGNPIFVILQDDETILTVAGISIIAESDNKSIYDRTSILEESEMGGDVWNLSTGARADGAKVSVERNRAVPIPLGEGQLFQYDRIKITPASGYVKSKWRKGDVYGFQTAQPLRMPNGFKMGFQSVSGKPNNNIIVFDPSGTSGVATPGSSGISINRNSPAKIYVYETIAAQQDRAIEVTVLGGAITVKAPGEASQ